MEEFFVGIDGGSTAVKAAVADGKGEFVYEAPYRRHLGQVARSIEQVLGELYEKYPDIADVSFTGYNTIGIAKALVAKHFMDSVAQKTGVLRLHPDVGAVVSFGGQGSGLMLLRNGKVVDTVLNSVCAAGTGSFFEMQAVRINESKLGNMEDPAKKIDEALRLFIDEGLKSREPADIGARCSVFAESDMIHKASAGIPMADILAGLAKGLARAYASDFLRQKKNFEGKQLLIGGGSLNALLLKYLRGFFPELAVPEHATSIQAYGAALLGMKSGSRHVFPISGLERIIVADSIDRAPRLVISRSILPENTLLDERLYKEAYLGLDIGSTTTKCALIAFDGNGANIIHKEYIKTEGDPIAAVKKLLSTISGKYSGNLKIAGVGTTGSGRLISGYFVGADEIVNEITAHATAAVWNNPDVDTIVEIGGQDSKYVQIRDGHPVDFTMNKVCSAGTGSFLEKWANRFGIGIKGQFQDLALSAEHPVALGERCTVFMDSDIASALHKGASLSEICAGLSLSVIHNYMNRVVEHRPIGENIMFLGGPSRNKAVVAALEQITQSEITVPPHSEVFGAIGAAMHARNKMLDSGRTESAFRGFGIISEKLSRRDLECRACGDVCTLQQYDIPMREPEKGVTKVISGGVCRKYETGSLGVAKAKDYSLDVRALFEEMVKVEPLNRASQRTVILPRHLYMYQLGVFWAHFFYELGIQPVLGRETTREMIELGTKSTPNSLCFSRIVGNGHIAAALGDIKDNTFLFLPTIIDVPSPREDERSLYCPWVAASNYTARAAFSIDGNVLSPVVHLKERPEVIAHSMLRELESKLRMNLDQKQIQRALEFGLERQQEYERALTGIWAKAKDEIGDGPAMVVVGRPYMLHDNRLNLNIHSEIANLGVPAMPMDILPVSEIDISAYDNMYWALGAKILRATDFIRSDSRLFMVNVTNFGCGPDSFILKYTGVEMAGKPSLELEFDALTAKAGVLTRLEAFLDVVMSHRKNLNLLRVS